MSSTLSILTFSAVIQVIIPVHQGVFKSHQVVQEVEDMFYYDDLDVYPDTGSLQSKDLFVKFVKKYDKKYSSKDEIKLRYELFKLKLLRDGGDYDENTDLTKKELDKYHSKYSTQSITTEVMNKTDTTENVKSTDHPSTSTHRYDEPSITTKTTTEVENSTQSTTTVKFGITEVMNTTNTTENANSTAYPSTSAHGHDDPSDIVETETGRPDETSTKSLDDYQSTQNETSLKNALLSTEKTNESVSNITQNVISRMSKDENEHVTESKSTHANNDACMIKYESGTFNSSSTTPNITQRNEGIQIIFNNSSIIFNIQRDVILYPYFDDYIKKFIYNMSTAKTFDSIPPTNESTKQFCTVTKTETTDNKNVAKPITDMIDEKESNLEIHTIVDKDVLNDVTEQSGPKKSTTSNEIKFKGRKVDILEPLDILTEITDITESSVLEKIYRTASITNNTEFTTDNVNDQEFKSPKSENTLTTKLSGSSPTIIHISNTKQIDVESTLYDAKIDTQKTQAKFVPITDRASGSIESDTGITKVTSPTIIKTEPTFGTTESYSEIEHEISTELPSINEFSTGSIKLTTEGTQFSKNIITIIDPVTRVIEEMTTEKSGFKKPITLNTTEFESHQTNLSEAMTNKTDLTHPTEIPTTITETTESHRTAAMTNKTEMTFDYRTNKAIKDSTQDQPHTLKPSGTTPTIIDITQTEPIDVGNTVYHGKMNEYKTQTELVPITDRADGSIDEYKTQTELVPITDRADGSIDEYKTQTELVPITDRADGSIDENKTQTELVPITDRADGSIDENKTQTELVPITDRAGGSIDEYKTQTELVPNTDRASKLIESDTGVTEVISPAEIITEQKSGKTEGYSEITTEVAGITEFSTESVGTEFNKNITKMIRSVTIIEELEMATNKPNDSLGTKFESRKTNLSESITNKIDLTHPTEIFTETTDITEITGSPTLVYITNIEDEDVNRTLNHRKIDKFENQTELVPITDRANGSIESDTGTTEKTSHSDLF